MLASLLNVAGFSTAAAVISDVTGDLAIAGFIPYASIPAGVPFVQAVPFML
jgi:hypothetical protein